MASFRHKRGNQRGYVLNKFCSDRVLYRYFLHFLLFIIFQRYFLSKMVEIDAYSKRSSTSNIMYTPPVCLFQKSSTEVVWFLDLTASYLFSTGVSTSTVDLLLTQHSALCQINCLVLTPPVLLFSVKGHKQGHVQVIDSLLSHGFEIVAMRMVWFHRQQAQEFMGISSKSYPKLVREKIVTITYSWKFRIIMFNGAFRLLFSGHLKSISFRWC